MVFQVQDVVEYTGDDREELQGELGVVSGIMTKDFMWPAGQGDGQTEIQASEDNPVYIVPIESGGSILATEDELMDSSFPDDREQPDMGDLVEDTSMSATYHWVDDPEDYEEFRNEQEGYIRAHHAAVLARHRGTREMSVEELLDVPKVDDPGIGFDPGEPEGWDRMSYLQAWADLGATWRSCYADMSGEMSPRQARRWCSALKDEIYRTTEWRNGWA